jgi:hypothetical protein
MNENELVNTILMIHAVATIVAGLVHYYIAWR